jgi:SAM-dependent methyltransferase
VKPLTDRKKQVMEFMDGIAERREGYIRRSSTYYKDLIRLLRYCVPEGSDVLEIGCGTGHLLASLKPARGVGIDISAKMLDIARGNYSQLEFVQDDVERMSLKEKFDYVIISDTLGYLEDIQKAFQQVRKICHSDTRIVVTYHSFLWQPLLSLAELLRLKMPQMRLNWLNREDIENLLLLTGFEVVKRGRRLLLPFFFPVLSWLLNRVLSQLPLLNRLCLTGYIIARAPETKPQDNDSYSVSVIIPARNEKGNIEEAVRRCPKMGKHTELIFVEGHSTDGTLEEIERVCRRHGGRRDISYAVQDGKGKFDAVRKGFSLARGDILMILDADLTVPPEDLVKFYNGIASGRGEFINGSRLVYPMEKQSMRILNMLGNKFFSLAFTWLLGQRLKDTLCGTKVLHRKSWERICRNRQYFGDFDPFGDFDLIFGASKLNLKIVEVPIRYQARQYGTTNISRFKHGWLLLRMAFFAIAKIKFL